MKRTLLLLLAACGLPGGDVLSKMPTLVIETCEQAKAEGKDGFPCTDFGSCALELPPCCNGKVVCLSGVLKVIHDCTACSACSTDDSCEAGTWCIGDRCDVCPKAESCKACPDGFVPLTRNGCATCDCGPAPASCDSCPPNGKCAPGAYCVEGCTGSSCCVQQCTPETCGPSPVGCSLECGPVTCAGGCYAAGCTCNGATWSCTPKCAAGAEAYASRCKA